MSLPGGELRFPRFRVLLPRTRLAYVHVRNMLTDAKRDRSARVFGYICVWLPDEFLLLFMQEGEVVNATSSHDGQRFQPLAIADAVAKIPREAEYGEVCFHEADDEQLAIMYWTQINDAENWPDDVSQDDAEAVLHYLHGTMFDGVLKLAHEGGRSYAVFRQGALVRGYFADDAFGAPEQQVRDLLAPSDKWVRARFWAVPPPLPTQAPPALIQAYRELMTSTVQRLLDSGVHTAEAVAEHARLHLVPEHPALERFSVSIDAVVAGGVANTLSYGRTPTSQVKDPIVTVPALSAAVGAWLSELIWTASPADGSAPERFLEDLLRARRHMFQSSGLFEALPWKLFV